MCPDHNPIPDDRVDENSPVPDRDVAHEYAVYDAYASANRAASAQNGAGNGCVFAHARPLAEDAITPDLARLGECHLGFLVDRLVRVDKGGVGEEIDFRYKGVCPSVKDIARDSRIGGEARNLWVE